MTQNTAPATQGTRPTIEVNKLSKWYGNVVAVNDVTLNVYPGITGLLGPNGAGKTTLLHMMTGLVQPSEGDVTVLGEHVRDNPSLYRRIGVMAEHESVYQFLTGRELVTLAARLYGVPNVEQAVDKAVKAVNLTDAQFRKLGTYSRGMRQRMRLAATLVHDPDVLILDEPLNGTDPRQRLEYHELMRRMADEGKTILVSSHILEEVETLADRILLMVSGKLAASGDFRAIREMLDEQPYKVRVVTDSPRSMAAALVGLDAVDSVSIEKDGEITVLSRNIAVLQRSVAKLAKERGIRLKRVEPIDESLESVFSYVVER
ncbi:MAG: ABC transporter ATP-binding protein [SAR202 cluster bacterium]|nr:ABC transporter ATP-binding protein [SAR202 cluster bacterium]